MYANAPHVIRAAMPDVAEQILTLIPPHSNDYYLEGTVIDICDLLPEDLAVDADAVFVARTPVFVPNAEAYAPAEDARVVCIYQGVSTALGFYAYLMRRSYRLIADQDLANVRTAGELLNLARAAIPQLLTDADVALVLDRRRGWLEDVDIDAELTDLQLEPIDRVPTGESAVVLLHDLGEHFVVAHEIAHHLLGHTHHNHFAFRLHPARAHLVRLRAAMSVAIDEDAWTPAQIQEFDADALAFLCLAGEVCDPGSFEKARWYGAIMGALLALPTLEDLALMGGAAAHRGIDRMVRAVGETHPPILDRLDQIIRFVAAFPAFVYGSESEGHPGALVGQALVFRDLLVASRSI